MLITVKEFESNVSKYLSLVAGEDIYIARNGKNVAKLTNAHAGKVELAKSLFGILPADASLKKAKEERLKRYGRSD